MRTIIKEGMTMFTSKKIQRTLILSALTLFLAALGSIQIVYGAHHRRLTRRDTQRLTDPRRYAVRPVDGRSQTVPKNYRPSLGKSRFVNGSLRYSSHYQSTNRAFYTNSGRRVVQDRAGNLRINNNRTQFERRKSTRKRW